MIEKFNLKDLESELLETSKNEWLDLFIKYKNLHGDRSTKLTDKYKKKLTAYLLEIKRLEVMKYYENQAYFAGADYVCGIDEVGRGPLAGPVVTAAVIMPKDFLIEGINDSKKLSANTRKKLCIEIKRVAIDIKYGYVDNDVIDEINILNATKRAMLESICLLGVTPDILLIDALTLPDIGIKQFSIIKGDEKSISIASASIMAKVTRDAMMEEFDEVYPGYGFAKNKGYGTQEHIAALKKLGPCSIHRNSFIRNFI